MEVFRLSKCHYIKDLSGTGARLYGGRWNSKNYAVVYTAGSRSLAVLESLVHLPLKNFTTDFCMAVLELPDKLLSEKVGHEELSADWNSIPYKTSLQELGNNWLKRGQTAILQVPSVIVPEEYNYLLNPQHEDFKKIRISGSWPFSFDDRLRRT